MKSDLIIKDTQSIKDKIFTIRNTQVMLDKDLAELYDVETKRINESVRNNTDKFPSDFLFELTQDEFDYLRSNISTTNFSKTRVLPKVFTEQGIYMLATILKSKTATSITVSIIRTFANLRKLISSNNHIYQEIQQIKKQHIIYELKNEEKFDTLFNALEDKSIKPTQGIFYDGEIFDAYIFITDLIKKAKKEIILVDNYIDETVLTLFSKFPNIKFIIHTKTINKELKLDFEKYNAQYNNLEIKVLKDSHDRFIIIDKIEVYHLGASLKDLGKKWFAFSLMIDESDRILKRLGYAI